MLIKIEGDDIHIKCGGCGIIHTSAIKEDVVKEDEVFGFNSYPSDPCPECSLQEFFTMTIPLDEMEEFELETHLTDEQLQEFGLTREQHSMVAMPYLTVNERYYLRQLIRRVRPDMKEAR